MPGKAKRQGIVEHARQLIVGVGAMAERLVQLIASRHRLVELLPAPD